MTETEYVSNKDSCRLIWQNLISNAVKYTPEDGEIRIKLYTDDVNLIFEITNTGDSLRGKENLIFQSFYTSDESGKEKGMGLGLPLVKKVLGRLGGSIETEFDKDTAFTVRLPLNKS